MQVHKPHKAHQSRHKDTARLPALRPENGAQSGGDAPGDPERARRADGSEPWAPGPYAAFTLDLRGASLVGRGVPRGNIRLSFALAE